MPQSPRVCNSKFLGNAIVISILPEPQPEKNGVSPRNHTVGVSPIHGLIVFSKSKKPICRYTTWRRKLRRVVAKQFCSVVYAPVITMVQHQPRIVRSRSCPGQSIFYAIAV